VHWPRSAKKVLGMSFHMNRKNRMSKILVPMMFVLTILIVIQTIPLASAVSGSDTPTYAYDYETTTGWWGDKYANADRSTGKVECYVYTYTMSCEAWGGVFGEQTSSGSYRWSVSADVELTAYMVTVGALSTATCSIYFQLLDASYTLIEQFQDWSHTMNPDDSDDVSFGEQTLSHSFSTYRSNVKYIGVVLYTVSWNGGKVCQDASHTTIDYPAYIEVSEISWNNY